MTTSREYSRRSVFKEIKYAKVVSCVSLGSLVVITFRLHRKDRGFNPRPGLLLFLFTPPEQINEGKKNAFSEVAYLHISNLFAQKAR